MTRAQKTRLAQMEELQNQAHELACAMAQDWLDAQAELIRRSQEILDIKGMPVFDGVRELIRTSLPNLQSQYETNGQVSFKTLGVKAQPIKEELQIG